MEHDYIHTLAPSDNGLEKFTVDDIKNNPKILEIININRKDMLDKYHALANVIIARDKEIEDLTSELKTTPSTSTRLAIVALNVFGTTCSSIGMCDYKNLLFQIILVAGILMVLIAAFLTYFQKHLD